MRKRTILCIQAAILALAIPINAVGVVDSVGWLLDVTLRADPGAPYARPVALITADGRFLSPPEGGGDPGGQGTDAPPDVRALLTAFAGRQRQSMTHRGVVLGSLLVNRYQAIGAGGFGQLLINVQPANGGGPLPESALGFSGTFPGRRAFKGRVARDDLKAPALDLCRQILAKNGVEMDRLARCVVLDWDTFALGDGRFTGCAIHAHIPEPKPDPIAGLIEDRIFLIAELVGGSLTPKVTVTYSRHKPDDSLRLERLRFCDVFDSNGHIDKFVLHGYAYEDDWYEIYQRQVNGRYVRIYRGADEGV